MFLPPPLPTPCSGNSKLGSQSSSINECCLKVTVQYSHLCINTPHHHFSYSYHVCIKIRKTKKHWKLGRNMEVWEGTWRCGKGRGGVGRDTGILDYIVPTRQVLWRWREAWPSLEGPVCILSVQGIKGPTEALRSSLLTTLKGNSDDFGREPQATSIESWCWRERTSLTTQPRDAGLLAFGLRCLWKILGQNKYLFRMTVYTHARTQKTWEYASR